MYQWKLSAVCVHHTKWKSLHINNIWYLSNNEALLQVSTGRCVESSMAKVLSVSQVTNVLLVCRPGLGWTKKSLKINKQHADLTCNIEKIMHSFNYNKEESALFLPVADRWLGSFPFTQDIPMCALLETSGCFWGIERAKLASTTTYHQAASWGRAFNTTLGGIMRSCLQYHTRWHHEVVPSIPH